MFAQRSTFGVPNPLWEDTAINPHDFTDEYYWNNGINPKAIIGRRSGIDGLSVFSNSSNPFHTNVRVIATIPAYDQDGSMIFWYPLGELQDAAFRDDKIGARLRNLALDSPLYVFPTTKVVEYRTFSDMRQAALMDNSRPTTTDRDMNPLGVRAVVFVSYTEKAFSKEAYEMMMYFMKKNGASTDDTPMIRTMEDLMMLSKYDLIEMTTMKEAGGRYALSPAILDPTKGAIAPDAYLWMALKDDRHLPGEDLFVWQFHCLQKTGNWCP
jgi:hypothetical protein